jgi:hypothetical protein
MQQYEVDEATAVTDATALALQWKSVGIISE